MPEMKVREILADIKKERFNPVYILMGPETYYLEQINGALEKSVVNEDDKSFDYNVFYGAEANADLVMATARQFPVMSTRRLVILKEAQAMQGGKRALDKFASYVESPSPNTVFVIVFKGEMLNATSPLIKAAKHSDAVIFRSEEVRDWNLVGEIRSYCQQQRISIDDDAADMLRQYIGGPLDKLFGEIDKLLVAKGRDGGRINVHDVEENIGVSKEFNNFELTDAISRRDYDKSMRIIKYFESNHKNNPTVVTAAALFNFFQRVVCAHYLPDKSADSLTRTFNLRNKKSVEELMRTMRQYNPLQAVNAIHYIREFDTASKGIESYQNEYDLLGELIFKIMT